MRIRAFVNGGGGEGLMAFAAMVMVECTLVGVTTLSKAAMSRGMNRYVFVVYYNAVGTLILLPSFIFSEIYRTTPPLTFPLLFRFYLLGLIGSSALMFGFTGIDYSSPTLSSAIGNLVPAFTFILAIIFRMEKVDVRRTSSQAKLLGTIVSITGAFIVTLYKGPPILSISTPSIPSSSNQQLILSRSPPKSNWILGGLFLSIDWFLLSTWYVLQASIVKEYPAKQTIIFFYCLFATIQSAVVTLIAESDLSVWRLRTDIELLAILYSGVFGSVVSSIVHAWALHKKGPVFVAMFKPMGIIVAIVMGLIFLGDILHIGSLIGSVIIAAGFYGVMWGKSKEVIMVLEKEEEEVIIGGGSSSVTSSSSNTDVIPLLQSRKPWCVCVWLLRTNGGGEVIVSFAAMVMVECALVGISTLSKADMSRGMSPYLFVVYYNALGTLFLLGLIRSSVLMFGYIGIDYIYSSPTLSSPIGNLVPAFTFILAIIFRHQF